MIVEKSGFSMATPYRLATMKPDQTFMPSQPGQQMVACSY